MSLAMATRGVTATAMPTDEAALMARLVKRDSAVFRTLVGAHALRLRRIAYRMIGDATEAEDIAQEALLRLWEHAARWQPTGSPIGAWLTRVAINLCFDYLRRRRNLSVAEVPERVDDAPNADTMMDSDRMRAATIACVQLLSERQRAAIVLTYYEELPNISAAEVMDMNIKGFESLLFRARTALRATMLENTMIADAVGAGE